MFHPRDRRRRRRARALLGRHLRPQSSARAGHRVRLRPRLVAAFCHDPGRAPFILAQVSRGSAAGAGAEPPFQKLREVCYPARQTSSTVNRQVTRMTPHGSRPARSSPQSFFLSACSATQDRARRRTPPPAPPTPSPRVLSADPAPTRPSVAYFNETIGDRVLFEVDQHNADGVRRDRCWPRRPTGCRATPSISPPSSRAMPTSRAPAKYNLALGAKARLLGAELPHRPGRRADAAAHRVLRQGAPARGLLRRKLLPAEPARGDRASTPGPSARKGPFHDPSFLAVLLCLALPGSRPSPRTGTKRFADIRQELTVLFVEMQRLKRELSTTGGATANLRATSIPDRVDALEAEVQRLTSKDRGAREPDRPRGRGRHEPHRATSSSASSSSRAATISTLGETTTLGNFDEGVSAAAIERAAPADEGRRRRRTRHGRTGRFRPGHGGFRGGGLPDRDRPLPDLLRHLSRRPPHRGRPISCAARRSTRSA